MTVHKLDLAFPYIVFAYGFAMVFFLNSDLVNTLAEKHVPGPMWQRLRSNLPLAWISIVGGGLWILQNLWLGT